MEGTEYCLCGEPLTFVGPSPDFGVLDCLACAKDSPIKKMVVADGLRTMGEMRKIADLDPDARLIVLDSRT